MTIDTGNTGFMLLCCSLVMLMTPGLAFFYGGLVGRKNVLAIMIQSFVSMGWTTVLWCAFGYSLCFSGDLRAAPTSGDHRQPRQGVPARDHASTRPRPSTTTIPLIVFFAYQMMFAIITPALITGAFANRVTFKAYLVFLDGLALSSSTSPSSTWSGAAACSRSGACSDFAGGIVVHNIAGIAALASVFYVGKRKVVDRGPHSIPLVALGTGLLWFGWYGFNAGSEFRVDAITALAFLNTDIAASFAGVTWLVLAWIIDEEARSSSACSPARSRASRPSPPAAGYVSPTTAALIGIIAGVVCYYAVALKNRLRLGRRARRLGRARRRRLHRHHPARRLRLDGVEPGGAAASTACSAAARASSSSSWRPSRSRRSGPRS